MPFFFWVQRLPSESLSTKHYLSSQPFTCRHENVSSLTNHQVPFAEIYAWGVEGRVLKKIVLACLVSNNSSPFYCLADFFQLPLGAALTTYSLLVFLFWLWHSSAFYSHTHLLSNYYMSGSVRYAGCSW